MFQTMARPAASLLAALLLFPTSNGAYEVPLASRSVRDAYFLGQRNNESTDAFLEHTLGFSLSHLADHISLRSACSLPMLRPSRFRVTGR